jgi:hypothetical protein
MINSAYFLTSRSEYDLAMIEMQSLIDTTLLLPEYVFKRKYAHHLFCDAAYFASNEFWRGIKKLCVLSQDEEVLIAINDRDVMGNLYSNNWIRITSDATVEEYESIMDHGPSGDSSDSAMFSFHVAWMGKSGKWAIWGQREFGVCVVGLNSELMDFSDDIWSPIDTEWVIGAISFEFPNFILPANVEKKLYENYG